MSQPPYTPGVNVTGLTPWEPWPRPGEVGPRAPGRRNFKIVVIESQRVPSTLCMQLHSAWNRRVPVVVPALAALLGPLGCGEGATVSMSPEATEASSGTGSASEVSTLTGADTTAGGSTVTPEGTGSSTGGPSTSTDTGDATTAGSGESGESSSTGTAPMCRDTPVAGSGAVTQAISVGPSISDVDDVEVDADGNIFIAGTLGNGDFGVEMFDPPFAWRYLAKFDSELNPLWARLGDVNPPKSAEEAAIEIDDNGDVISTIAGLQKVNGASGLLEWSSADVDDVVVVAGGDAIVRQGSVLQRRSSIDASVIWETTIPALDAFEYAEHLDAGSGRVLLTGRFTGTIPTAAGDVSSVGGGTNTVVLSVDLAGDLEWGYTIVGDAAVVRDIAVDPCGGAYVYGDLDGIADFGEVGGGGGVDDLFLVHLDEGGTPEWSRVYLGRQTVGGTSVTADSEGSALLTGYAATLNLDGIVVGGGSTSGFVAKLNRGGDVLWASDFDSPFSRSSDVAVDALDNPILVGEFRDPITLGRFNFTPDNANIFVATLEP